MIVDKLWKLTNTVRVGLDPRSSHGQTQSTFPDTKRNAKSNTGESVKDKRGRTVSDHAGGKSLSDTSMSEGEKSTVIRISVNIFETSKSDKP